MNMLAKNVAQGVLFAGLSRIINPSATSVDMAQALISNAEVRSGLFVKAIEVKLRICEEAIAKYQPLYDAAASANQSWHLDAAALTSVNQLINSFSDISVQSGNWVAFDSNVIKQVTTTPYYTSAAQDGITVSSLDELLSTIKLLLDWKTEVLIRLGEIKPKLIALVTGYTADGDAP